MAGTRPRDRPSGLQVRRACGARLHHPPGAERLSRGRYASDMAELELANFPANVRIFIRGADERGWSASATHANYRTSPCILNVGEPPVSAALRPGSAVRPGRISPEGEVQCAKPEE